MQRWIQSSCSFALRQKNSVSGTGTGMGFLYCDWVIVKCLPIYLD